MRRKEIEATEDEDKRLASICRGRRGNQSKSSCAFLCCNARAAPNFHVSDNINTQERVRYELEDVAFEGTDKARWQSSGASGGEVGGTRTAESTAMNFNLRCS